MGVLGSGSKKSAKNLELSTRCCLKLQRGVI